MTMMVNKSIKRVKPPEGRLNWLKPDRGSTLKRAKLIVTVVPSAKALV
jgi:hypothetical protein